MPQMEEIIKMKEAYEYILREKGQDILRGELAQLWKCIPERVTALKWRQYTPYFNDGEECVFGVHPPELQLEEYEGEEYSDYGGRGISTYALISTYEDYGDKARKLLGVTMEEAKDLHERLARLWGVEDVFRACFGDHVEVTAHRDGTFESDKYEHE